MSGLKSNVHAPTCSPRPSISELCFCVEDAWFVYRELVDKGVECLSAPQAFDFRESGFGRSLAFYLRDPDGIILEVMQPVDG